MSPEIDDIEKEINAVINDEVEYKKTNIGLRNQRAYLV